MAVCGGVTTSVVCDNGSLYTFGRGGDGKLGLGDTRGRCLHCQASRLFYVQASHSEGLWKTLEFSIAYGLIAQNGHSLFVLLTFVLFPGGTLQGLNFRVSLNGGGTRTRTVERSRSQRLDPNVLQYLPARITRR